MMAADKLKMTDCTRAQVYRSRQPIHQLISRLISHAAAGAAQSGRGDTLTDAVANKRAVLDGHRLRRFPCAAVFAVLYLSSHQLCQHHRV